MSELTSYNSERIYWSVEQVEREAGDIDDLHLDDNLFYLKSEADEVIAELERQIEFLKVTHGSCGECNKCADGMGKVFDENLNELKAQKAQAEDDCAYWKIKAQKNKDDKYISELKKERDWLAKDRAQAYDDLEKRAQLNIRQEESIRHHKYKRCLAMARWCRSRACFYDTMRENSLCWGWKSDRAYKWHKRWLELAEKFKEAK